MKKALLIIAALMMLIVTSAFADGEATGYKVTYLENDCLALVPEDKNVYQAGDNVEVLFEPVQYKDYLIFYGWDMDNDGVADFGYSYKYFNMPAKDVELKAICISANSSAPAKPGPKPCYPNCGPAPKPLGPAPAPKPWGPAPAPKPWGPAPKPWH